MDGMMFAEQLRSGLVLWDVEQMFHFRLSDGLVEALAALGIGPMDRELKTKKDCDGVAQVIEANRGRMDAALYADCMAELREVRDDVRWFASRVGKRVMAIERWLVEARKRAEVCFPQNEIVMGRDLMAEPDNLTVGIVAATREEYEAIRGAIASWQPPVKADYKGFIIAEQP